ncbi:hypothetical protein YPPY99_4828, partial [Yersinia pestis PY-99]
MGVGL